MSKIKIALLVALISCTYNSYAQYSEEFFINGVSSKLDIGGVEAIEQKGEKVSYFNGMAISDWYYYELHNYHNFPVTVLLEISDYSTSYGAYLDGKTFSIVIPAKGVKKTPEYRRSRDLVGIIVRKVG